MTWHIKTLILSFVFLGIMLPSTTLAKEKNIPIAIALKAGTLGAGLELDYQVNEQLNFRLQANGYSYDDDFEEDGIDYSGEIDLSTTGVLIDWRPFSGTFRLSAGFYANGNELSGLGVDNGDQGFEIGDQVYYSNPSDPLSLALNVELGKSSAGYLGIGWGNHAPSGWTFSFELGVLFTDTPKVDLNASGSAIVQSNGQVYVFDVSDSSNPLVQELNDNIAIERANLENDISDFEAYPVIALGIGYRF
ncbi:hypothetical protein [Thalassotalea ganghwensis]